MTFVPFGQFWLIHLAWAYSTITLPRLPLCPGLASEARLTASSFSSLYCTEWM